MNPFRRTLLAAVILGSLVGSSLAAPASVEAPAAVAAPEQDVEVAEAAPETDKAKTEAAEPKKKHRAVQGSFDELKARYALFVIVNLMHVKVHGLFGRGSVKRVGKKLSSMEAESGESGLKGILR